MQKELLYLRYLNWINSVCGDDEEEKGDRQMLSN